MRDSVKVAVPEKQLLVLKVDSSTDWAAVGVEENYDWVKKVGHSLASLAYEPGYARTFAANETDLIRMM